MKLKFFNDNDNNKNDFDDSSLRSRTNSFMILILIFNENSQLLILKYDLILFIIMIFNYKLFRKIEKQVFKKLNM